MNTPLWGGSDDLLLVSSAYKSGSRALRLKRQDGATEPEELWFNNRVRFMFLSMIRLGDYVYGTSGDLGPSFLTAIDIRTGEMAWQHRGISRASIVYADDKAILLEEDGDLTLARLAPEGVTVLAQQPKLFDTMSWTAPTLIGTTLYARDREKIVALDLGKDERPTPAVVPPRASATPTPAITEIKRQQQQGGPSRRASGTGEGRCAGHDPHYTRRQRHGHRRGPDQRESIARVPGGPEDVNADRPIGNDHDDVAMGRAHAHERRHARCEWPIRRSERNPHARVGWTVDD
jgi:hypothetical protein